MFFLRCLVLFVQVRGCVGACASVCMSMGLYLCMYTQLCVNGLRSGMLVVLTWVLQQHAECGFSSDGRLQEGRSHALAVVFLRAEAQ